MRNTLFFILIFATSIVAAQPRYTYQVEPAGHDVWLLKPTISDRRWVTSNIIVIANEKSLTIVDTGLLPSAAEAALEEIKKLSSKPVKYVINTHWHGDHWQGNEVFKKRYPDAEFIASARGLESIQRNGMVWATKFYQKYWSLYLNGFLKNDSTGVDDDGTRFDEAGKKQLKRDIVDVRADIDELKKLKPTYPTITFDQSLVLREGSREMQLHYLGIGNTVGDIVVFLPKEKMLITGDLVVYPSPYESGAFSGEWVTTMKKLKSFDASVLLPGHGDVLQGTAYLDFLIALFEELRTQMDVAYKSGVTSIDEARKVVTHESVTKALSTHEKYRSFLTNLDSGFVPAAVSTVWRRSVEGKL